MTLSEQDVLEAFSETGALLDGDFVYSSGRHGRQFLQAARVLQYPNHAEKLCAAMAGQFSAEAVDLVVGPATGGIILAYETARHLNCRAAFTEKDENGGHALKRGFTLEPGTRTLVVEDIITTGGSVKKVLDHLRNRGAEIVGVSVLIDRSAGEAAFDCSFRPLAQLSMESWAPEQCPLCAEGHDLTEPDDLVA